MVPPFTEIMASFVAPPATTVNAALVNAVKLSGFVVAVAVSFTPLSATLYVTLRVSVLLLAVMVPLVVPPSVPVPAALVNETTVSAETLDGLPKASSDLMTTLNVEPAAGLLPPLIEVITNCVSVLAPTLKEPLVPVLKPPAVAFNVYDPAVSMRNPLPVMVPLPPVVPIL